MKLSSIVSTVAALTVAALAAPRNIVRAPSNFVTTQGRNFFVDGSPFRSGGGNAYYLFLLNEDADVVKAFQEYADASIKTLRIWAFREVVGSPPAAGNFTQLWKNGVATCSQGGQDRLKLILDTADSFGIRVTFVLTNNWSVDFPANPAKPPGFYSNSFGGIDTYVQQIHPGAAHDTFYTDPKIIAAYKKYLSFVVPAFKNHPALFSWELANDPRCQGASGTTTSSTCNTVTITTWVKEIAAFVKSLDPNHLVGAGDSGFFCTQPTCPKVNGPSPTKRSNGWDKRWVFDGPAYNGHFGIDTLDICNDPNIDLCTIQFFPDQQDYSETPGGSPGLTGASVTSGIDFINFHHSEGPNKPLMLSAVAITNQDNAADLNNFDSTTVGTPPGQPVATAAEQLSAFNSIFSGNGNVTALFTWEQQVAGITSGAIISKKRQTNIGSSPNDGMQVSPGTPVYQSAINNNKAMAAPPT